MSFEVLQGAVGAASEEAIKATTESAVHPEMDLEAFLDDAYLKSEPLDDRPVELAECRSRRGSTGHAWQS